MGAFDKDKDLEGFEGINKDWLKHSLAAFLQVRCRGLPEAEVQPLWPLSA